MRKALLATLLIVLVVVAAGLVYGTTTTVTARAVPYTVVLQSAATTGSGNIVDTGGAVGQQFVWITWSAGCSAGAVQIETSDDSTYTGTWAPLSGPIVWTAASKKDVVQITAPVGAVRARISTTIVGGTIDAKWQGF